MTREPNPPHHGTGSEPKIEIKHERTLREILGSHFTRANEGRGLRPQDLEAELLDLIRAERRKERLRIIAEVDRLIDQHGDEILMLPGLCEVRGRLFDLRDEKPSP